MRLSKSVFKALSGALLGMGVIGVILLILLIMFPVIASVYGLVLAFKASIVLGILVLLIEPAPFVIGAVALLTGTNLADRIMLWFNSL